MLHSILCPSLGDSFNGKEGKLDRKGLSVGTYTHVILHYIVVGFAIKITGSRAKYCQHDVDHVWSVSLKCRDARNNM